MANEKFYLDFISDGFGKVYIDEPFGFNSVSFDLNQKEKGMSRDVQFNGGESQFEFTHMRNHYLDKILYYHQKYGFESKVILGIEIKGFPTILGDLDFAKCITDGIEYFKCKVIQQSDLQIIKRRKSVKVDVFSDKDLDGNPITPLVTENMLFKAKPVFQTSKWEQSGDFNERLVSFGIDYYYFNPAINQTQSEIEDTLGFFEVLVKNNTADTFSVLKAKNPLKKIQIDISDVLIHFDTDVANGGNGYAELSLVIKKGKEFATAEKTTLFSAIRYENESYDFSGGFLQTIESVDRGESVWVYFELKVRESTTLGTGFERFECRISLANIKMKITAESTAYNSIVPSFRLVDVMRQVIKSISGNAISAPRFDVAGQFYDNRLFNGNFLRNVLTVNDNGVTKTKPFLISLEDIEQSMVEMKGDYEVNDPVFFGIEKDYYTNIESGFFDDTQFSKMNKVFNDEYCVISMKYGYKNYQALKEISEPNSADVVHGMADMLLANKMVENKKEVVVEWNRDSFLGESSRRKGFEIASNTSAQEDDSLFCWDTVKTVGDQSFEEVSEFKHEYNAATSKLSLRILDVNLIILGIEVGTPLVIYNDLNQGSYIVFSITPNELMLTKTTGTISASNDGVRVTKYAYTLLESKIPFTNYTNQGFTEISNLNGKDSYSNLRYSVKRNVENYYNSYLATCNLYHKEKAITVTDYKNNGLCSTTYLGKKIVENAPFVPSNPILSPMLFNDVVFANVEFADFIALQNNIRSQRGYIRSIDNTGNVIKLYPKKMSYENLSKELTIVGEEKFEPIGITIVKKDGLIEINSETILTKLIYKITGEMLYLYDLNNYRLYNSVYINKVSINGSLYETEKQLDDSLKLL